MNPIEEIRRKNHKARRREDIAIIVFGVTMAAIVAGVLGFYIWIWIKYGNMPAGEVPAWIMWLMGK